MGFWSDFQDNVLGSDPGLSQYDLMLQAQILQQRQNAAAAAAAATPATPAPQATPTPAAPVAQAPAPQVSTFDPTPYRGQVDTSFSQFTPDFYANRYASVYNPYRSGVESQFGLARDALTTGVARRGLENSQQSRGLFQQLDALRDQALNTGQGAAQGFQTSLSDQVNTAKNNLYGSIGEGADNASIGSRASAEAGRIAGEAAPPNTLGDVFGALVQPYANSQSPGGPVNPETRAFATGGNLNLANASSSPAASTRVVGASPRKKF